MRQYAGNELIDANPSLLYPRNVDEFLSSMNLWFEVSARAYTQEALDRRADQQESIAGSVRSLQATAPSHGGVSFTLIIQDADAIFPSGEMRNLTADRLPIVYLRNWARNERLGDRNRIILICKSSTDLHESLRSEGLGVSCHTIAKPTYENRLEWITNFRASIQREAAQKQSAGEQLRVGSTVVTDLLYGEGFTSEDFATQSAGVMRRTLKNVVRHSWLAGEPITVEKVREVKQNAMREEFGGAIEYFKPTSGFEFIGGHDEIKRYMMEKIILPLRTGNRKECSAGLVLSGPGGTGKTRLAMGLAYECNCNFILWNLRDSFGSLVGATEKAFKRQVEGLYASVPLIAFIDELDTQLSSGRVSTGDGGAAGGLFNAFMQFASAEERMGKIVLIGATNHPELLDSALIRPGRFDEILACLPPHETDQKGRMAILNAISQKLQIAVAPDLVDSVSSETNGLGALLRDTTTIWTGAEYEKLYKKAVSVARRANRMTDKGKLDLRVTLADMDYARKCVVPNSRLVKRWTDLALTYHNDNDFLPPAYREQAEHLQAARDEEES